MTNTQSDRRRHTRIPIECEYHLFLKDKEYSGKTANISLSGAYLSKSEPDLMLSCISEVGDLKINLNNQVLPFKCEIVHVTIDEDGAFPIGAGVVFSENDDETGRSILQLARIAQ